MVKSVISHHLASNYSPDISRTPQTLHCSSAPTIHSATSSVLAKAIYCLPSTIQLNKKTTLIAQKTGDIKSILLEVDWVNVPP